ncbi:hypothetical protein EUGRSUZ_A02568 [Eucalyptus grandis]|uniref:Uncharacterized protein n=2 Tax=Eucalyptus grandis TaxID=71139 RepID=A0ACC3M708_EUCGR|nr:hypothetical protein EUGRSUZ_A02568 [Eucalyptus grandis]
MARREARLAFITNEKFLEKARLKKRRRGLLKRASELGNPCSVNASAVVCSPDSNELLFRSPPRSKAEHLLGQHRIIRKMERSRKVMNQERYLKERAAKVGLQKERLTRENKDNEIIRLVRQLHILSKTTNAFATSEMYCLFYHVQEKKKEIKKRIEFFEQANSALRSGRAPPAIEGPMGEKGMTWEGKGGNGGNKGSIGDASSPTDSHPVKPINKLVIIYEILQISFSLFYITNLNLISKLIIV